MRNGPLDAALYPPLLRQSLITSPKPAPRWGFQALLPTTVHQDLTLVPSKILLQLHLPCSLYSCHCPILCSLNMKNSFQPQDLCTRHSLCEAHPSSCLPVVHLLYVRRSSMTWKPQGLLFLQSPALASSWTSPLPSILFIYLPMHL